MDKKNCIWVSYFHKSNYGKKKNYTCYIVNSYTLFIDILKGNLLDVTLIPQVEKLVAE